MNKKLTAKNISIFITIIAFCFYILPFLILRDKTYIHVHDNLDSVFLYYHHLANFGHIFSFNADIKLDNVMNGLPIGYLPSSSFTVLLFYLFGSLAGYIINDIIVHLVGFIGMYLLFKKYFIREPENQYIIIALSLCFALIPFETLYGISVSGQPFLLYAFLNILSKQSKIQDYICIVFFPFYSWLAMSGVFIICALGVISIVDTIKNKKLNLQFFFWIAIFMVLYCVANYRLLSAVFFSIGFISHRVEWGITLPGFMPGIKSALLLFLQTQYHSGSFTSAAVILAFLTLFIMSWKKKKFNPMLFWLLLIIIAICLFHGFYPYLLWAVDSFIPFLKTFQADRFYFLLPLLWFILFAVLLNEISLLKRFKWIACILLFLHLTFVGIYNREYRRNFAHMVYKTTSFKLIKIPPSFEQFFAENLFSEVDKYINMPKKTYRVVSIGLHPSIAQYNGFYTLDSYQNNYPLEYKHKFRRIIAKELEKKSELKNYFDTWGSRCYIFVAETGDGGIDNLEINTEAFKELGGKYIFSAHKINNYEKLNLTFHKLFDDKKTRWKVYLYQVN